MTSRADRWCSALLALLLAPGVCCVATAPRAERVRRGFEALPGRLSPWIEEQARRLALPAVLVSVADARGVLWEAGFGVADPATGAPATADTVVRVGSVSKLFTDLALMQLVDEGRADLDAPARAAMPRFAPANSFGEEVTLRHLLSHRSGLCREPPVGSYFDASSPSLAATVDSLNGTALVEAPGTRTKYSNAAVAAAGRLLELQDGLPFAESVRRRVIEPLGLARTSFEPPPEMLAGRAAGTMWTLEGGRFPAPTFPLGTSPAGNLWSSAHDLGELASALLRGGEGRRGRIATPETLEAMWTPQFSGRGPAPFGLGFVVSSFEGRRTVGHGGAIYGFATEFLVQPDDDLAVAVAVTLDGANAVATRIAREAIRAARAARAALPPPELPRTEPVGRARARALAGRYACGATEIRLVERSDRLFLEAPGATHELRAEGSRLVVDDPLATGPAIAVEEGALAFDRRRFERVGDPQPPPPPDRWQGLLGKYGWDHNTLLVLEGDGRLCALVEWFERDPLLEIDADTYALPDTSLYRGERLLFRRGADGRAVEAVLGGVRFPRRPDPNDGGEGRIRPVAPVASLVEAARRAAPPREEGRAKESDLVELVRVDPTIRLDVRYATPRNFLGEPVYPEARAFLQRPAAEALARAHRALRSQGYGLLVHDGYRPWWVTKVFWDATPERQRDFVADPAKGSRHNRGCAADVTLFDLATGRAVEMTGEYDEASPRSYPAYPGGTSRQRWHRELLRRAMEAEGFEVFPFEWWHFDFHDWRSYPILNASFSEIAPRR